MNKPSIITELLGDYTNEIDTELTAFFKKQPEYDLYKHLAYFMGFADESLKPIECYGGKRFRSALCLLLADWYGAKDSLSNTALSIELFHNFTLIHDDIVDGDTLRRGRPTVWKLWGKDHAINSGDAQSILAQDIIAEGPADAETKLKILRFLSGQYLHVIEGQYLDFHLTDLYVGDDGVTEEAYFEMIERKTAALVAASTKVVGIGANLSEAEQDSLYEYGYSLGVAYQLCDDAVSIWGTSGMTGKRAYGDILERKKTLPILYALAHLDTEGREELLKLYNGKEDLHDTEAEAIVKLLDAIDAYEYMNELIKEHADRAKSAVEKLSLSTEKKETLKSLVDALLPTLKGA